MCKSVRGLMLGCLAFSVTYALAGVVQVVVGVVFMLALPIFRLASNIWTGGINVVIGGAMTIMVCWGPASLNKHRACLALSIAVVLVNLSNLVILELCEWRAFLPPIRIQNIMREDKTDLLMAAYLSSTISTAVALVVGFVACEYIYCLLIAAAARTEEEVKPDSRRRGFPCRNRRTSWYEPISFSWVFEASDNFNSSNGTSTRMHTFPGVSNKTFRDMSASLDDSKLNTTYVISKQSSCGSASTVPVSSPTQPCNGMPSRMSNEVAPPPNDKKAVLRNGSVPHLVAGRVGADSKSSSGYSSPDWLTQRCNTRNLYERGGSRFDGNYENLEYLREPNAHFSQEYVSGHCVRNMCAGAQEREVRSLMQLPIHHETFLQKTQVNPATVSPVKQSTLPLRGHRKRALNHRDEYRGKGLRHKSGKSPRKRHKSSAVLRSDGHKPCEDSFALELADASFLESVHPYYRPRLSSTPEKDQAELIEIQNLSSIEPAFTNETFYIDNDLWNKQQHHLAYTFSRKPNIKIIGSETVSVDRDLFDVPSCTSTSRRSSMSDEVAIFDVTANFRRNTDPSLDPSTATESLSHLLSIKDPSSLACHAETPGEEDDDPLDMSDSPSHQGSLTSVTCLEDDVLSPLSDYQKDVSLDDSCTPNNQTFTTSTHEQCKATLEKLKSSTNLPFSSDIVQDSSDSDKQCSESSQPVIKSIRVNGFHPIDIEVKQTSQAEPLLSQESSTPTPTHQSKPPSRICQLSPLSPDGNDVSPALQKILQKKLHKKGMGSNTWTGAGRKSNATDDGISFKSLDRSSISQLIGCEDGGEPLKAESKSEPTLHWKPCDNPRLYPIFPDDGDSLVNLSNLELIARQWRNCSFHKQLHRRLAAGLTPQTGFPTTKYRPAALGNTPITI